MVFLSRLSFVSLVLSLVFSLLMFVLEPHVFVYIVSLAFSLLMFVLEFGVFLALPGARMFAVVVGCKSKEAQDHVYTSYIIHPVYTCTYL